MPEVGSVRLIKTRAVRFHNGTRGQWRETLRRMPRHRMPDGLLSDTGWQRPLWTSAEWMCWKSRTPAGSALPLLRHPALACEKRRIQAGEGLAQFLNVRGGSVNFNPGKLGKLQHFLNQIAHVLQMHEHALGSHVSFAAKDLLPVPREIVVEAGWLAVRSRDKPLHGLNKGVHLSLLDLEVGMQTDGVG